MIGYQFNHHDALEDAKAAGAVLIALLKSSNQNIDNLMEIVNRPVKSKWEKTSHSREGNPDGSLFGEVILFSDFSSEDKERYSDLASQCGCNVKDSYSKKVTILVVPHLDVSEKTGKYKKVEEGVAKGLNHQLLDENGFLKLIESATTEQ
jgi:DNA polymerase-3 subunit epsilon